MTDIVKRLRADADRGWLHPGVAVEAADEIERLRNENERHLREKVELAGMVTKERDEIERLRGLVKVAEAQEWSELQKARAEIERLRAALRYARDVAAGHVDNRCYDCLELMQHIDRELAEGK